MGIKPEFILINNVEFVQIDEEKTKKMKISLWNLQSRDRVQSCVLQEAIGDMRFLSIHLFWYFRNGQLTLGLI